MSLVAVYEDLLRRNAPSHLTHIAETLQLLHCGIFLDDHHALFDWRAVTDYGYLARLLVHPFPVFGLHSPACLFLDYCSYQPVRSSSEVSPSSGDTHSSFFAMRSVRM